MLMLLLFVMVNITLCGFILILCWLILVYVDSALISDDWIILVLCGFMLIFCWFIFRLCKSVLIWWSCSALWCLMSIFYWCLLILYWFMLIHVDFLSFVTILFLCYSLIYIDSVSIHVDSCWFCSDLWRFRLIL